MATVVFMGTPDFAVPTLNALIQHHKVIGVVTQPDRPAGRKNGLKAPPVKELALAHNIPVLQPEKLRHIRNDLQKWEADVFIVAAFGQILPQSVLDMPKNGCINVHGSLLPRWRGAAPIHAAIRTGDPETGITIMLMDAGLDTGAMLTKSAIPILPDDTTQILHDKMAHLGADLLIETIPAYLRGDITPQAQDEALVTIAPQIEKEEGHVHWSLQAIHIERLVRAFTPWPSTYTFWEGKQLKIHKGRVANGHAPVGQVVTHGDGVAIGTGENLFLPLEVQLEGKKRVSIAEFLRGYPHFIGATLK
jgi:methionyl-tRNA formyltransferase